MLCASAPGVWFSARTLERDFTFIDGDLKLPESDIWGFDLGLDLSQANSGFNFWSSVFNDILKVKSNLKKPQSTVLVFSPAQKL